MRACLCRSCGLAFTVGHPEEQLRRRARELAGESRSWAARLLQRRKRTDQILARLVEEYYAAEPHRYEETPRRCPTCGARDGSDLPWWEPNARI